jgi:hypothetical protein
MVNLRSFDDASTVILKLAVNSDTLYFWTLAIKNQDKVHRSTKACRSC